MFQHTAARRRLPHSFLMLIHIHLFQHTAARRRLRAREVAATMQVRVSTHSRPKAAAFTDMSVSSMVMPFQHTAARRRLPANIEQSFYFFISFNTQPPEGGCTALWRWDNANRPVSTHSRPKAAAYMKTLSIAHTAFQHTAARRRLRQTEIDAPP